MLLISFGIQTLDIRLFEFMVKDLQQDISQSTGIECVVLEREDAPDYVTIN